MIKSFKKIFYIVIFLICFPLFSQTDSLSFRFNELSKLEIIKLIEKKTNYKFYFIDDWLDKKPLSSTFDNTSIEDVLDVVFEGTTINYFILNNSDVILTNGNLIKPIKYENKAKVLGATPVLIDSKRLLSDDLIKIGKEKEIKTRETVKLSGIVRDFKTKKPLEGVIILEKEKNIYTVTDNKGFYNLLLPYGRNTLDVRFVGFESQKNEVIIYDEGNLNFLINEKPEELDEVIINASVNKKIRQTMSGVNQIKVQEIKTIPLVLGERDILKVAATLPSIKSSGEGAEGVNVRGGKVDQNLFLLDNGVIYNPSHFLGLFSAINPFTTNGLKIFTGHIPSEFGGRLSSVFEITTNDSDTKKIKGEASIGPVTGNVNLEIPIVKDKSGLILGVRTTYSDWIFNVLNNSDLSNSSASFFDVISKYKHVINKKNSLKLTGYYSEDKYQIASDTINKYGNRMFSLNWEHKFSDDKKGNLVLYNSNYAFNIDYETIENNLGFNLEYKINETAVKYKIYHKHSNKHKFNYGVESKLYNINPGTISPNNEVSSVTPLTIEKEKALESALYVSDEITFNKKLSLNLGFRINQYLGLGPSNQRIYDSNFTKNDATLINTIKYDNNEVFKSYYNPSYRISAKYVLDNDIALKSSINKSYQYIHRLNNNTSASPIDTWRLSDNNIKPQEGTQISLGVFKNINNDKIELSLEGYYKSYKNLLDYKVGANLLLNENIETEVIQGKGKSYGLEVFAKKSSGKINGWLSYAYSKSLIQLDNEFIEETVNNGNYFPTNYDKPHDFNAVLNYKLTNRYSISSNFTYQTGRPITYPTGKYIINGGELLTYSNRNEYRIPDYYRLDIGINIEGNHKIKKFAHSFWNISVYNVLGRNNPYSVYFETSNGSVKSYKTSIFSIPIPTITYNFKF